MINVRANGNIFRVKKITQFLKMRFFKHPVSSLLLLSQADRIDKADIFVIDIFEEEDIDPKDKIQIDTETINRNELSPLPLYQKSRQHSYASDGSTPFSQVWILFNSNFYFSII